jgi:Cas7 group CRISPR-associated protein Csh2
MSDFNRATGLLVIEVRGSNPNGDPDAEGEPRTLGADRRGLISPVSFKRKLRDLVADKDSAVWQEAERTLKLRSNGK